MNFIINNIFLITIIVVSLFLLLLPTLQGRGASISTYHVTKKMNESKVLILDVSKPEEFATGHVPKAMNIPIAELPEKLGRIERYKTEPIVIVCATGSRAAKATTVLKKAGFKDVSSMEGGMKEWKSQNMPLSTNVAAEASEKSKQKGKAKA